MELSENFTLKEFTKSPTALRNNIDNTPNKMAIVFLSNLVKYLIQPARYLFDKPITISSGYRCDALNKKLKGSKTSQHPKGQAGDLDSEDNVKLFNIIRQTQDFDQLIAEYPEDGEPSWVHASYVSKSENRNEVLICTKEGYLFYKGNENLIYKT